MPNRIVLLTLALLISSDTHAFQYEWEEVPGADRYEWEICREWERTEEYLWVLQQLEGTGTRLPDYECFPGGRADHNPMYFPNMLWPAGWHIRIKAVRLNEEWSVSEISEPFFVAEWPDMPRPPQPAPEPGILLPGLVLLAMLGRRRRH